MQAPITADLAFVVMVGAAMWTSLQLALGPARSAEAPADWTLLGIALIEGLLCAVTWSAVTVLLRWQLAPDVVMQSVCVGAIWSVFTAVCRLSLHGRSATSR